MQEQINISEKDLFLLLSESFDQGFGGYQELKESSVKKILNKYKKNKLKTVQKNSSTISKINSNGNYWKDSIWGYSGTAFNINTPSTITSSAYFAGSSLNDAADIKIVPSYTIGSATDSAQHITLYSDVVLNTT